MRWLQRIFAIMVKEARQVQRDRLTFAMIVGIPLMQIILFGYAINTDVRGLRAGVVDLAESEMSRRLMAAVEVSQVAEWVMRGNDVNELTDAMRRGDIKLAVVIPEDFERRLSDPTRAAAQVLVDGSDPTIINVAQQLSEIELVTRAGHGASPSNAALRPHAPAPGLMGASAPRVLEPRNYYNPERRSAVQIVPALIGVILTLTMVLFTSVAVVRERERGNYELLITTPIKNVELMIGKITPYILIGVVQVSLVLGVGIALFNVPVDGSVLELYVASLLFIAATLGLGLTISTFAKTQFQAMQLTLLTFLPSMLLSGFMFPFDGMPAVAQWIGLALPLTHFIELVRGIMLRGAALVELMTEVYALLVFFLLMMTIAVLRLKKRLD